MGKIPESTSLKISDFIFRFRESSQKFVVEILTQNFAFNLSGTLFFIGLGCSLKWWYKDQLLITLLKQNLPAFSQPQQKISWETGEYLIGEQTHQFIGKKSTFGVCTLGLRRCTKEGATIAPEVNPFAPGKMYKPNVGAESMHSFADLGPVGSLLGPRSGLKTKLFSDQVFVPPAKMGNQDSAHSAKKKVYEKTAVRGSEAVSQEWIESEAIKNKALSLPKADHVDSGLPVLRMANNALLYTNSFGARISLPNKQKNNIRFGETRGTEPMLQKVNLLFTPQVRKLSPCSFNDLLDRTDVYSNSVVIHFRSPWQKHAYHRFVGIFSELNCAETTRGTDVAEGKSASDTEGVRVRGLSCEAQATCLPCEAQATSVHAAKLQTSTKFVHSVFQKYTFWGPPKNWFKLSARGLCILNQASPLTSSNYSLGAPEAQGVDRLWTFFRKPLIQTLKFPFNAVCEIPEKNIVVVTHAPVGAKKVLAGASNQPFQGKVQLVKVIGKNEDAFTEHYFAPLVVDQISPSQLASSMDDKARTLLVIEKFKSSVQKIEMDASSQPLEPLTGTDLLYSTILNKGLAELSVIVNNRSFVDGINFRSISSAPTTKEKVKDNMSLDSSKVGLVVEMPQVLSTQTKNFSYPLELTPKMDGWQPPVEKLFFNSYLDEIPYKLENTLWATTRQISNRRLGLCNSNWLVKQLLGASNQPLGVDDACTEGGKKKAYLPSATWTDEMFPKNKDQTLIKSTKKLDKGVAGFLPPLVTTSLNASNQPLKSMEKKLQLIGIKQLLKNELQTLVNSLPVIFVDRSSRSESNYQANNMESCTRSSLKRDTWLIPNRKKLDDLCTFDAEQIAKRGGVKKREIQGAEALHLHLPVHKVHELDRHKEEKSTQQKVSPTSPFVYEEKEKNDVFSDTSSMSQSKAVSQDNAFSVVSRDTSSLFTKRTLIDQGKPPFDVPDIEDCLRQPPLISGSQTKIDCQGQPFFLLNSLGITFNNLSYLKDPPVLLPMNQDASFWRWNRKKVGMSIMHRLRRATRSYLMHGLRRFGGTDEMFPKNTITPYVNQRYGNERLNSLASQDNEKIVTHTTFRFDPNTITWQVLQQLNCDQSPKNGFKSSASSLSAPFSALSMSMQQKSKTPTLRHAKKREDKKPLVQKPTRSVACASHGKAKRVHFINQIILKQKKISLATNSFTSFGLNISSVPETLHDVTSPVGANAILAPPLHILTPSVLEAVSQDKVHDNSQIAPTFHYSPIASALHFGAQQELELRKIDNINLVDTQVSLTNKRGRLMSGYIYPDTQSASLMPNLYRWTYSAFPFGSTKAWKAPITLAKSTDKKVRGCSAWTDEMLQNQKANLFSTDGDKNLAPWIHDCLLHSKMFPGINRLVDKACLFKVCTSGAPTTICRLPWCSNSLLCAPRIECNKNDSICYTLSCETASHPLCGTHQTNKANINRVVALSDASTQPIEQGKQQWNFEHHLGYFPGFIKPNQFILSINQIAQGSNLSEDLFTHFYDVSLNSNTYTSPKKYGISAPEVQGVHERKQNLTQNKKAVERSEPFDCSPRKTAYNGIVVQRNPFTKDLKFPPKRLERNSILGTSLFGPENPFTDRQSHFFGQRRLSPVDVNVFQRDYLRQLGKETLLQSNPKGFTYGASVERVKILSFSKAINSFLSKKRKYTYLLEEKDQWHLLFQEQLRTALEDTRKYPPLTTEESKDHGLPSAPGRIKVSAPLMMARFPKKSNCHKVLAHYNELLVEMPQVALSRASDQPPLNKEGKNLHSPAKRIDSPSGIYSFDGFHIVDAKLFHKTRCNKYNHSYCTCLPCTYGAKATSVPRSNNKVAEGKTSATDNLFYLLDTPHAPSLHLPVHVQCAKKRENMQLLASSQPDAPHAIFTETWSESFHSTPLLDKSSFALGNNNLSVFLGQQWFTQEPLNANSWLIISQWSFLVALLFWIEQTFLADIFPALFALEQLLLGTTGMKSDDRTHVTRVSKGEIPKFKDIAGIDGLLGELAELVLFLRGHKKRLWNKVAFGKRQSSYGVLLTGPPGTGKTFLVRALANEAKVPVLILSAGVLTANKTNNSKPSWSIRHAFRRAKQLAPCILFIDEIDALGRSRGNIVTDINEIVADANLGQNVQATPLSNSNFFNAPEMHLENSVQCHLPSTTLANTSLQQQLLSASETQVHQIQSTKSLRELASQGKSISAYNQIDRYSLCADASWLINALPRVTRATTPGAETKIPSIGDKTLSTGSPPHDQPRADLLQTKENIKRKFGPLTQLLVSMDGVSNLSGVLIIGATNRPESLDPALTRPGRFERIIRVEKPAEQKRIEILKLYSRNLGIQKQIPWSYLANRTMGLTAADLAVAMNYSSLKAILQSTQHTIETIEYGLNSIARFSSREVKQKQPVINKKSTEKVDIRFVENQKPYISPGASQGAESFRKSFPYSLDVAFLATCKEHAKRLDFIITPSVLDAAKLHDSMTQRSRVDDGTDVACASHGKTDEMLQVQGKASYQPRSGVIGPKSKNLKLKGSHSSFNKSIEMPQLLPKANYDRFKAQWVYKARADEMHQTLLPKVKCITPEGAKEVQGCLDRLDGLGVDGGTDEMLQNPNHVKKQKRQMQPQVDSNNRSILITGSCISDTPPSASISDFFSLTTKTNKLEKKRLQRLTQIAYYQSGKIVVQTLLPLHPPVALITLNLSGITTATSADTYIPIDGELNTHWCSFLESRLMGLYGGKASSLLLNRQHLFSIFSEEPECKGGISDAPPSDKPYNVALSHSMHEVQRSEFFGLCTSGALSTQQGVTNHGNLFQSNIGTEEIQTATFLAAAMVNSWALSYSCTSSPEVCADSLNLPNGENNKTGDNPIAPYPQLVGKCLSAKRTRCNKRHWGKRLVKKVGDYLSATSPKVTLCTKDTNLMNNLFSYIKDVSKCKLNNVALSGASNQPFASNQPLQGKPKGNQCQPFYPDFPHNKINYVAACRFYIESTNFMMNDSEERYHSSLENDKPLLFTKATYFKRKNNSHKKGTKQKLEMEQRRRTFESTSCNISSVPQMHLATLAIAPKFHYSPIALSSPMRELGCIGGALEGRQKVTKVSGKSKKFVSSFTTSLISKASAPNCTYLFAAGKQALSYSPGRVSIEDVAITIPLRTHVFQLVNPLQFSISQRDRFYPGWFRLYLPDIEATEFMKNVANYYYSQGLQTLTRTCTVGAQSIFDRKDIRAEKRDNLVSSFSKQNKMYGTDEMLQESAGSGELSKKIISDREVALLHSIHEVQRLPSAKRSEFFGVTPSVLLNQQQGKLDKSFLCNISLPSVTSSTRASKMQHLEDACQKLPFDYNDASFLEKELIYHSLVNNCFSKAFFLIDQNRQLTDYFADYLVRFQILRQHQILYLFSTVLFSCKKQT